MRVFCFRSLLYEQLTRVPVQQPYVYACMPVTVTVDVAAWFGDVQRYIVFSEQVEQLLCLAVDHVLAADWTNGHHWQCGGKVCAGDSLCCSVGKLEEVLLDSTARNLLKYCGHTRTQPHRLANWCNWTGGTPIKVHWTEQQESASMKGVNSAGKWRNRCCLYSVQ